MRRPARIEPPAWKMWAAPTETDGLWSWQDDRCAWCGYASRALVRDHCHMTGLVRGWLCSGCNTREGVSYDERWDGWRNGDNTANAIGHYEIYRNHMGVTNIAPQSALHYFSHPERVAWYELVVAKLTAGEMTWPEDAPWIPTAVARKEEAARQMQVAMDNFDLFPGGAARYGLTADQPDVADERAS